MQGFDKDLSTPGSGSQSPDNLAQAGEGSGPPARQTDVERQRAYAEAAKRAPFECLAGVLEGRGGGEAPPFSIADDGRYASLELVRVSDDWRLTLMVERFPDWVEHPGLDRLDEPPKHIPAGFCAMAIIERDGRAPHELCAGDSAAEALRGICRRPVIAALLPLFCIQLAPEPA